MAALTKGNTLTDAETARADGWRKAIKVVPVVSGPAPVAVPPPVEALKTFGLAAPAREEVGAAFARALARRASPPDRRYRSRRDAARPRSFPDRASPGAGRRDAGLVRASTFTLPVDVPDRAGADIVTVTLTAKRPAAKYVCRPITVKSPSPPLIVPRLTAPSPQ